MHPVENKILNYLLDKYENSKLSRGENQRAIHIAFPFNKKTMPKYFDESSLEIETIHAAAEQMEREGLVAIAWKNQKPGYIIEKLVLCEDHVEEAYERLGRKPKREAEARTKQILEQFYQKTQGEITRSFLSHMIMRLEREQSVKEYLDIMDHRKTEQLIDTLFSINTTLILPLIDGSLLTTSATQLISLMIFFARSYAAEAFAPKIKVLG